MRYLILGFVILAIITPALGLYAFKETLKRTNDIYRSENYANITIIFVGLLPYWITAIGILAQTEKVYMYLFGNMYIFAFPFFLLVLPMSFVIYRAVNKDRR